MRREPSLAATQLSDLPDLAIDVDDVDAYNAVNGEEMSEAVIRVLKVFAAHADIDPRLLPTLIKNLTSGSTALGYGAQFQGYDWLLRQGSSFTPEVKHALTLRGTEIALDGRFDSRHGGAFFDIKSYAFEPQLRAVFKRRLEKLIGNGVTITIDGGGNHAPDAIQAHAFRNLKSYAASLAGYEILRIPALNWTVTAHPSGPGVTTSNAEYNSDALAHEHRLMPLWFASQFTIDMPYILIFVLPYGFGGNPFAIDVSGSGVRLFDKIAAHIFDSGRADFGPAVVYDDTLPAGITVAQAVASLSGLALLSEPGSGHPTIARIHLNGAASHPLTSDQARSISSSWTIVPHP
jgi:hypothetical protein